MQEKIVISANDESTGMTFAELRTALDRAERLGVDPESTVHVDTVFRGLQAALSVQPGVGREVARIYVPLETQK